MDVVDDPELRSRVESVAAIAIRWSALGEPDNRIETGVRYHMARLEIYDREHALLVVDAIQEASRPEDGAEYQGRRRRVVEGPSAHVLAEDRVAAMVRAEELVLRVADSL